MRRGADQIVTFPNFRLNSMPLSYLNSATVQVSLVDPSGNVVRSGTMIYVTDSNGTYQWAIDGPGFMIPASSLYKLVFVARQDDVDYRTVVDVTVSD